MAEKIEELIGSLNKEKRIRDNFLTQVRDLDIQIASIEEILKTKSSVSAQKLLDRLEQTKEVIEDQLAEINFSIARLQEKLAGPLARISEIDEAILVEKGEILKANSDLKLLENEGASADWAFGEGDGRINSLRAIEYSRKNNAQNRMQELEQEKKNILSTDIDKFVVQHSKKR